MQLKNFTFILCFFALTLLTSINTQAQSFDVSVDNITLDCTTAPSTLTFTIYASSDAPYLVDNWNLFLYFNSSALSNLQVNFAPGFTGNYGSGLQVLDGITQFNTFWNGAANGQTESFENTPTELATLTFDVIDGTLPSGLLFEASQTFGSDNNFQEFYTTSADLFGGVSISCNVAVCEISNLAAGAQSLCSPNTNTYTQEVIVTYQDAPAGGQLVVNGQNFAITGSPQSVVLTGLDADGGSVGVTAFFTDDAGCTLTVANLFTAPVNCTVVPVCGVSSITAGTQTACEPVTNTYTQEITITYENAPVTGELLVNGQSFAISGSPQTVTLTGLTADGGAVSVTASFTDDVACSRTASDLFTAPVNCEVIPVCNITSITVGTQSACDPVTNTYSQELTITYENEPILGDLVVNGKQFAISGSPQTVLLEGLVSDGLVVSVTASFSDDLICSLSVADLFTAPVNCEVVLTCAITGFSVGNQTACDPATNTYSQDVRVTYENAPLGGSLVVNGQSFPITGSPQMVTLTGLPADAALVSVSAFFTDDALCVAAAADLFSAPEGCSLPDPCEGVDISVIASYTCPTGLLLSATGGQDPYTYTSNGQILADGELLNNGDYSIIATDANGCSNTVSEVLTVNSLTTLLVSYNCETGIELDYADGEAPISFTVDGNDITDGTILVDGAYLIEAIDANGCVASTILDFSCACAPNAGFMSTTLQTVCDGNAASVLSEGITVDLPAGETGLYLVHTAPDINDGEVIGVFVVPVDPTESFAFNATDLLGGTTNTVYYVSAIVGRTDSDSDGIPDLGDACTDLSESQPVVFLDLLVVDIQPICDPITSEYTLTVTANGGYPSFDTDAQYTIFGDVDDQFTSTIVTSPYVSNTAYLIGVSDGVGCAYSESRIIDCIPTPVTMIRFDGVVLPEGNFITWATASEINNDYFTLARSNDGVNFITIGTVKGAGTVSTSRSYELLDKNAPEGLSYYRLVQTDFNGTTNVVGLIVLQRHSSTVGFVEVSPIPTTNLLNISFNTSVSGEIEFTVHDIIGRKISSHKKMAQLGLNQTTLEVKNFAAGVYFISFNNGFGIQTTRFVKE